MNDEKRSCLRPDDDLREICRKILAENKSLNEWDEIESDDMFQKGSYCGGYDATEKEFLFSHYDADGKEWWFGFDLDTARRIAEGTDPFLDIRTPS